MSLEERIIKLYRQYHSSVKTKKIIKLLKMVFVDNEEDLDKIMDSTPIKLNTLQKYINEDTEILNYISGDELDLLKQKIDFIIKKYERKNIELELKLIGNVIDDIFNTRNKANDIYAKHFFNTKKIEAIFNDKEFMENNFGIGICEKIRKKLKDNGVIREGKPRNMCLIEDRWDVFLTKPDVFYLEQSDFKKLNKATSYLCSNGDIETIMKTQEIHLSFLLLSLDSPVLKQILKPEYYLKLSNAVRVEKIFFEGGVSDIKNFLNEFIGFLSENNYDVDLAIKYFDLPSNLVYRILDFSSKVAYIDDEIKTQIRYILNKENEKKVK